MGVNAPIYPWKRFWIKPEGLMSLADGGYLVDPDEHPYWNDQTVSWEKISRTPCLVLLGEPGMGKSKALQQAGLTEEGPNRLYLDLGGFGDQAFLHSKLFGSPSFQGLIASNQEMELVLDGFDECQIHIKQLAVWLGNELKKCPVERLHLRIASRTAEWPAHLSDVLQSLWTDEQFAAYELAPLRRRDVELAAQAEQIDSIKFLTAVDTRSVEPLAANPITLKFLLREFRSSGSLPMEPVELYRRGLLSLSEEQNTGRRASGSVPSQSPSQLLSISERIAAGQIFGKRGSIAKDARLDDSQADGLPVDALLGRDIVAGKAETITAAMVREALESSVFSGRSEGRMGFVHWSYGEFLAASFCVTRALSVDQIADLIFHHDSLGGSQVVPQLTETAAWLATMRPDVMSYIADRDPQVLMRSKVIMSAPTRAQVTKTLLRLAKQGKLLERDDDFWTRRKYGNLAHDGIAAQLEPYIRGKRRGETSREIALEIAEDCGVKSLATAIADVLLDSTESYRMRHRCSYAVARLGDAATKLRLKPFLDPPSGTDGDDTFKGNALRSLWPAHLKVSEVLNRLTPPKQEHFGGAYSYFVAEEFAEHLQMAQLPEVLKWLASNSEAPFIKWYDARRMAESIVRRASKFTEDPKVLEPLVELIVAKAIKLEDPFDWGHLKNDRDPPSISVEARRTIAAAAIKRLSSVPDTQLYGLTYVGLVVASDLDWAITRLEAAPNADVERAWASIISQICSWQDFGPLDVMLGAMKKDTKLYQHFHQNFEPIELGAERAVELRRKHKEWMELTKRPPRPKATHAPISEIIAEHLQRFDEGDLNAWWKMQWDLTLLPDSDHRDDSLSWNTDLQSYPNWAILGDSLRDQIVERSILFLQLADPETDDWLGTNQYRRAALAGVRTARLLYACRQSAFAELKAEDWQRWLTAFFALASMVDQLEGEEFAPIIALGYHASPSTVISGLVRVLDVQSRDARDLPVLKLINGLGNSEILHALLKWFAAKESLNSNSAVAVLKFLLSTEFVGDALSAALHKIKQRQVSSVANVTAQALAQLLLERVPNKVWSELWPLMQSDGSFGQSVAIRLATSHDERHNGNLATKLPESDAADLYVWLNGLAWDADAKTADTSDHFTDAKQVGYLRAAIINVLRDRGTSEAVRAIHNLRKRLPDESEWLTQIALAAERNRLRLGWPGISLRTIYAMVGDSQVRAIENGAQLAMVVLESLARLEAEFHGVTPAVEDVWNERAPKDENAFSNRVKRHLDRDLRQYVVLANREAEVRRGEETDIYVDALARESLTGRIERISLIIEVKGCWHRDLNDAMDDQLKKRYLARAAVAHGLYLIGWFHCALWKPKRSKVPRDLAAAKKYFAQQAKQISDDSIFINACVLDARNQRKTIPARKRAKSVARRAKTPLKRKTGRA